VKMPPVPPQKEYKYVNSLWCIYMVSVVSAWNAELGKNRTRVIGALILGKNSNATNPTSLSRQK
jgi:hypothetical protein